MSNSDFLRNLALPKKDPEFVAAGKELDLAHQYAARMVKAGKLSKNDFADYEALLYGRYLDALPVDLFHEMMEDGRLEHLQTLAGHDGTRNVDDVTDARAAIDKKIMSDALDDAWLSQKIDSKYYAEENSKLEKSEDINNKIADGDFDDVASEVFASRNDVPSHENDFVKFLQDKYGDSPTSDRHQGFIDRQTVLDPFNAPQSADVSPSTEGAE